MACANICNVERAPPAVADTVRETEERSTAAERGEQLARHLHANPETGLAEFDASERCVRLLSDGGFGVQRGIASLDTSFVAEKTLGGEGPTVGLVVEYDALPEVGHGCGHNLICGGVMEAALELAARSDLPGVLKVIGTPAEELFAGKAPMLEAGAFDGVDAVFTYHPSDVVAVFGTLNGAALFDLTFQGQASHAASRPWDGRSALDGATLATYALAMERQYQRDGCRIHAKVESVSGSHNILPDMASLRVNVRAPRDDLLQGLIEAVPRIAEGSAHATATAVRANLASKARPYLMHGGLARLAWDVLGVPTGTTYDISGSSDLGDVSQAIPTVCVTEVGWSPVTWHSHELHAAAGSEGAIASMHRAAGVLTRMVERFVASPHEWLTEH